MKRCIGCGETKPITDFYWDNRDRRHRSRCKACHNEQAKTARDARQAAGLERERKREYRRARPEVHRETSKRYRVANAEKIAAYATQRDPEKQRARRAAKYAVETGQLEREACEDCGTTENIHGHHEDYSKPLEVTWLCSMCHGKRHWYEAIGGGRT